MNLEQELEKQGITVFTGYGMDKDGLYLPDAKIIFINGNLDDIDRKNAILHELGHLANQHEALNCEAPILASKREAQADSFMIQTRVEEYLAEFDNRPEAIDVEKFLLAYHLKPRYFDLATAFFQDRLRKH